MSKSLCKGPLFLFLPIMLGGVVTLVVLRLFCLQPTWYWFLALFLLCCLLSMFAVGLLGYLIERWMGEQKTRHH